MTWDARRRRSAGPGLVASALPTPDSIPNNHLSYAIQWFLFAAIAGVIYVLALKRRERHEQSATGPNHRHGEAPLSGKRIPEDRSQQMTQHHAEQRTHRGKEDAFE